MRGLILVLGVFSIGGTLACQPAIADSTERVSVSDPAPGPGAAHSDSGFPAISGDGRFVAFDSSASDLISDDFNGVSDVFVRDRETGTTERVSISSVDAGGIEGLDASTGAAISADGRFVAFSSEADNLVLGDTNGFADVFVHDRVTGITERVSVVGGGAEAIGGPSAFPSLSADGRFVAFHSDATNLVPGDGNAAADVFVRDRMTDTTERVSVSSFDPEGDSYSVRPSISADGRFVAFYSDATNLVIGDTNGVQDVFVYDRMTDVIERVSVDGSGGEANGDSAEPSISAGGRFVAFHSAATNLLPGDANGVRDVFVRDRIGGVTVRVSVDNTGGEANGASGDPAISADGRFVTFDSIATSLVADDTNGTDDLFLYDRERAAIERVSVDDDGNEGNGSSRASSVSADGRFVAFASSASDLVADDGDSYADIFVRDRGPLGIVRDDLLVGFGAPGLWEYLNNKTWMKIHNATPLAVETGDLSGTGQHLAIASFSGAGLWARAGNKFWLRLHAATPKRFIAGDFDGDGEDELAIDFGGAGIWVRVNKETWKKLHGGTSQDFAVGDLDGNGKSELIVAFGGAGLWARYNDATWVKLHNASPVRMVTGDLEGDAMDELIADFGPAGLWVRKHKAPWKKLHSGTSQALAIGDLDGNGQQDLIVDFGPAGLWVRYNGDTWVKRHNGSPTHILTADLDDSGQDELVADFGPGGLWARFNDAAWVKLHNATAQKIAAGGFD